MRRHVRLLVPCMRVNHILFFFEYSGVSNFGSRWLIPHLKHPTASSRVSNKKARKVGGAAAAAATAMLAATTAAAAISNNDRTTPPQGQHHRGRISARRGRSESITGRESLSSGPATPSPGLGVQTSTSTGIKYPHHPCKSHHRRAHRAFHSNSEVRDISRVGAGSRVSLK